MDRRRERQTELIDGQTEGGQTDRRRERQTELIEGWTDGGRDRLN